MRSESPTLSEFVEKEVGVVIDDKVLRHRKAMRERFRERYSSDPEFREKRKKYGREASKLWRKRHPEKRRANFIKWLTADPERAKLVYKKWKEIPAKRMRILARARIAKSVRCGITYDRVVLMSLTANPADSCALCNKRLDYTWGRGKLKNGPSIDRVDTALGYVAGNIAVLCNECNTRKGGATAQQHREIAEFIERFKQ